MVVECVLLLAALGQAPGGLDAVKVDGGPRKVAEAPAEVKKLAGQSNNRELGASKLITSPYDAVVLALGDAEAMHADYRPYARYLWVPDWMDREMALAKASLIANSTLSRVPNIIRPAVLADGRLLRLDFLSYTDKDKDADELIARYENLAGRDSFFHIRQSTVNALVKQAENLDFGIGETVEVQTVDPKKFVRAEIKGREGENFRVQVVGRKVIDVTGPKSIRKIKLPEGERQKPTRIPAAYAEPELTRLSNLLHTDVPIMRLDEFVVFSFDSVNGGQYYPLTGLDGNFKDILATFAGTGAAAKVDKILRQAIKTGRIDPDMSQAVSLTTVSNVTGRQRMTIVFNGDNINPTIGVQYIWVTLDIGEDNDNPDADPFRNPLEFTDFDGGEAIFAMPNGLLAYVVFDKDLKVLNSVPDGIAHNKEAVKVRGRAATARVSSGLICARCHDASPDNYGFQPIAHDGIETANDLGSAIGDTSRPRDPRRANQEAASKLGADLTPVLDAARLTYQKQAHKATGYRTTRPVVFAMGEDYWGYWYDVVTPEIAARDLGFNLNRKDAITVLLAIAPSLENDPNTSGVLDQTLKEDKVLGRIKDGKLVAGMQWRTLFPLIAARARKDQVREKIAVLLQERKL